MVHFEYLNLALDVYPSFATGTKSLDLILCRNSAFTYWDQNLQKITLPSLEKKLKPGGFLVIGKHESLPETGSSLLSWRKAQQIYRKG